jgi:hypothetical protein
MYPSKYGFEFDMECEVSFVRFVLARNVRRYESLQKRKTNCKLMTQLKRFGYQYLSLNFKFSSLHLNLDFDLERNKN